MNFNGIFHKYRKKYGIIKDRRSLIRFNTIEIMFENNGFCHIFIQR